MKTGEKLKQAKCINCGATAPIIDGVVDEEEATIWPCPEDGQGHNWVAKEALEDAGIEQAEAVE